MSTAKLLAEALGGMFGFGTVKSTEVAASKSVEATIEGNGAIDGGGAPEVVPGSEMWNSAALLVRPAPPDDDGACEVMFLRQGDEVVGLVTKDRRWQVDLEEGEVVLRALGPSAARVRLTADGECVIEAANVKVGGPGATEGIGLGTSLQLIVNAMWAWAVSPPPAAPESGAALKAALLAVSTPPPTVASAGHTVES